MEVEKKLINGVVKALNVLYGAEMPTQNIQLQKTKKEFAGHLTLVVFPFLKISRKKP